jgi:hypothetical protein
MNKKTYMKGALMIIIIGMSLFLVLNWKTAFVATTTITYKDGCKEVYKNGNMTTPECTNGRMLEYLAQVQYNNSRYGYGNGQWGNFNMTTVDTQIWNNKTNKTS